MQTYIILISIRCVDIVIGSIVKDKLNIRVEGKTNVLPMESNKKLYWKRGSSAPEGRISEPFCLPLNSLIKCIKTNDISGVRLTGTGSTSKRKLRSYVSGHWTLPLLANREFDRKFSMHYATRSCTLPFLRTFNDHALLPGSHWYSDANRCRLQDNNTPLNIYYPIYLWKSRRRLFIFLPWEKWKIHGLSSISCINFTSLNI